MPKIFTKFTNTKYTPSDRECFALDDKKESRHFLTLGSSSYIRGVDLEIFSSFKSRIPHILIGRFSSLSWNLKFLMGFNHRYKNVVSTYAFARSSFIQEAVAQAENKEILLEQAKKYRDKRRFHNHHQIIIGNDVWIGRGATIMGGVKIGSGAIIGANATVSKDIPPYAIVAGNPAKIIKYRFDEETIKKFMAVKWWNWSIEKILENAPLMDNPEKFLEKHYTPELEKISYDKIPIGRGGY